MEEKVKIEPADSENQETQDVIINTDTAEEGEVVGEESKLPKLIQDKVSLK